MNSPRASSINWPILITVLSWGFNFVAVKLLFREIAPAASALVRFFLMWGILYLVCRIRKEDLTIDTKLRWRMWLFGFVTMGAYMVFFLEGTNKTAPAESAIILAAAPVFTYLMSVAFGIEKFLIGALVGAAVALLGVALVVVNGVGHLNSAIVGDLLVLVSALIWAYGSILSKPLVEGKSALVVQTLCMPGGLFVMVPYGLLPVLHTDWSRLSPTGWAMLFHLSVMAGAIGFIGFFDGVKRIGPSRAMLYQFFVPPTAAFFAWLVMKYPLTLQQGLGLAVVIAGVYWSNVARRRATA